MPPARLGFGAAFALAVAAGLVGLVEINARKQELAFFAVQAEQVRSVLAGELDDLAANTRDWATWDAAWDFAGQPGDPGFIRETLQPVSLRALNLSAVAFTSTAGPPLWAMRMTPDGSGLVPIPPQVWDDVRNQLQLATPLAPDQGRTALVQSGDEILAVAARPVVRSSGEGPPHGLLLMIRSLDAARLRELEPRLGRAVELLPLARAAQAPEVREVLGELAAGTGVAVSAAADGKLVATALFGDAAGRPSAVMRFDGDRWLLAEAHTTEALLAAAMALMFAGFAFSSWRLTRFARALAAGGAPALAPAAVEPGASPTPPATDTDLARIFVEQSDDGIVLVDRTQGLALRMNEAAKRLLGQTDALGAAAFLARALDGLLLPPGATRLGPREIEHEGADGRLRALEVSAQPLTRGEETLVCVQVRDVSARRQAEERIRHQAYHDSLTQLPNRQLFNDRLNMALAQARRSDECLGVLLLDLDHFKTINDTLGHDRGDELLVQVSERLRRALRECDTIARLGGDEFVLLLPRIDRAASAGVVAERVLNALRAPFLLAEREVQIGSSIGVAVFPQDGQDGSTLFSNADLAMYHAKQQGRNAWVLHDPSMNDRAADMLELKSELIAALRNDELFLEYQPQIDGQHGELIGFEALVRWRSPSRGVVPPVRFIPVAEETGLIVALGDWVLRAACRQVRAWLDEGLPAVRVAVNFSARQFLEKDLVDRVRAVLAETGCPPELLEVEVTESIAMKNADRAVAALRELRTLGLTVALDDFGTGYSSLAYLRQFPLDRLKIDRAFVREIGDSANSQTMVEAIVGLAHSLELEVCAEGVETTAQLDLLRVLGCDVLQGYGLARPMPGAQATEVVRGGDAQRWRAQFTPADAPEGRTTGPGLGPTPTGLRGFLSPTRSMH